MAKKKNKKKAKKKPEKLPRKLYEEELFRLQVELVKLQEWVKHSGAQIVVVFSHLLSLVPYEEVPRKAPKLPKRNRKRAYDDVAALAGRNFVPELF